MSDALLSDDGLAPDGPALAPSRASREPLLAQHEIDALGGWGPVEPAAGPSGVRGILNAGASPREPLPMLGIVFEDLVGRLAGSLRGLFGGDVAVALASIEPVRYGDFIEDIVLPTQIVTFSAEGLDGEGLVAIGPAFARLVLDALLGAGRFPATGSVAARPFSAIEGAILSRLADAVLSEAGHAFSVVAPVTFRRGRVEADPWLGNVARPGDVALAATISLSLDGRAGEFVVLIPSATLEPVRALLGERSMGVKLGRDDYWSGHLATEIWQARMEAEAVLHETSLPLGRVLDLAIGDTLMFEMAPTDLIEIRCGGFPLTRGRIGRVDARIAVQVVETLRPRGASARDGVSA